MQYLNGAHGGSSTCRFENVKNALQTFKPKAVKYTVVVENVLNIKSMLML